MKIVFIDPRKLLGVRGKVYLLLKLCSHVRLQTLPVVTDDANILRKLRQLFTVNFVF